MNRHVTDIILDKEKIADDLKIGTDLHHEASRTPILHNHYNVLLLELSKILSKKMIIYKKLHKEKWEYYSGKASNEVYQEKPFPKKILRADLHQYIETDDALNVVLEEIEELKNKQRFVEETLKQINQRTFHIKNAIDYLRFINGEN